MADNKTKATEVSVEDFIEAIDDDAKRADAQAIVKLLRAATGEPAVMWGPSIVGFGAIHYVYDSGREGDTPLVGFSPRKPATVFYGLGVQDQAALLARLGKHTTGKGCLYIKRLSDVDMGVFETLVAEAVKNRRANHPA